MLRATLSSVLSALESSLSVLRREQSPHSRRHRWRDLRSLNGPCAAGRGGCGRHPIRCTVVDAAPDWGGKIVTHRVGELVTEAGPDSFLSQKSAGLELCAKLGLTDQLINTNQTSKRASVYSHGRLHELPEGLVVITPNQLGPFLRSGLLSWTGSPEWGSIWPCR